MIREDAPIYPLCVELAALLKAEGREAVESRWKVYREEQRVLGKPVVYWVELAVVDTVRELAKEAV